MAPCPACRLQRARRNQVTNRSPALAARARAQPRCQAQPCSLAQPITDTQRSQSRQRLHQRLEQSRQLARQQDNMRSREKWPARSGRHRKNRWRRRVVATRPLGVLRPGAWPHRLRRRVLRVNYVYGHIHSRRLRPLCQPCNLKHVQMQEARLRIIMQVAFAHDSQPCFLHLHMLQVARLTQRP